MGEDELRDLRKAAPSAFSEEGLRPFPDQVTDFALGKLDPSEVLVLAASSHDLALPQTPDLPVCIDQSTIRKVMGDHGLQLAQIQDLGVWISEHPLAFESITQENSLVVVVDAQDRHENHVIVPLHLEKAVGDVGREITVNDVASVYGKRNVEYLINNTAKLGKELWVNERTKGWTSRAGLQLPPLASSQFMSEYTLLRVESLDDVQAPVDLNAAREVFSLEEARALVGPEEFDRLVCDCTPHAANYRTYEAFLSNGYIDFDMYLTHDDISHWESELRGHLADMYWDGDHDSRRTADELRQSAVNWLEGQMCDSAQDWDQECVREVASKVCEALEGLSGPWGAGIVIPDPDPVEIEYDLCDRYGLVLDTQAPGIVEGCSYPTTLLLDSRYDKEQDMSCSRHVLDATIGWMEAGQGPFDPAALGIRGALCRSSIEWLCASQGTTLADVLNGQEGPFAESLGEELGECGALECGWPHLAVMCDLTADQYFSALAASLGNDTAPGLDVCAGEDLGMGSHTGIGFYDPVNGASSLMGIKLERDLTIDALHIGHAVPDYDQGRYGGWYTLQECCGFTREAFSRELSIVPYLGRGERNANPPLAEQASAIRDEGHPSPSAKGRDGEER